VCRADHFADARDDDRELTNETKTTAKKIIQGMVHIRNQQRNGRKSLTTIQGLAEDLDLQKIVKYMRKAFNTNGTILKDKTEEEEHGARCLRHAAGCLP
jgi:translation initiation factor SUI1